MNLVAIRGAVTVEQNNKDDIAKNTKELIKKIEKENNIEKDKVVSIIFSVTKDLNADYPAKAARDLGYIYSGLMCFNEMEVPGSLSKCIRVMILYNGETCQSNVKHIYLKGARVLRPDLF